MSSAPVVLESFVCPLTGETFVDPVIDREGNSYERSAILAWLATNPISPLTRSPMSVSDLVPNRSLLDSITASGGGSGGGSVSLPPVSSLSLVSPSPPPPPLSYPPPSLSTAYFAAGTSPATPSHTLLVNIKSPTTASSPQSFRVPVHVVLVLDVSGSMGTSADTDAAGSESTGLSVLDVTKHAAKTSAALLGPNDVLSIVTYHDTAAVLLDGSPMTDANKRLAMEKLDALQPLNSTNLWDGLDKAMALVKKNATTTAVSKLASILLLTDGQPNIAPPRGHLPMLQRFLADNSSLKFTINTFGFGYSMNSKLLFDIAVLGSGSYSFIPDCGFVGTVFVHALTNILCNFAMCSELTVTLPPGVSAVRVCGASPTPEEASSYSPSFFASSRSQQPAFTDGNPNYSQQLVRVSNRGESQVVSLSLGALHFDECRAVIIEIDKPLSEGAKGEASLTYWDAMAGGIATASGDGSGGGEGEGGTLPPDALFHKLRLEAVDALTAALNAQNIKEKAKLVTDLKDLFEKCKGAGRLPPRVEKLLTDISGQVSEAVSKEAWYQKWGKHYLPSISRAHLLQTCTNFKDPGMQDYGSGALFNELRDEADDVFLKMPPPKPSASANRHYYGAAAAGAAPQAQLSSAAFGMGFYNSSNSCFRGDCEVTVVLPSVTGANEEQEGVVTATKKVSELQRGDIVLTGDGERSASIVCVVKTLCDGGKAELVQLDGGLTLTPYHPILHAGTWTFPKDVATPTLLECDAVYSFVLDDVHTIAINGVTCICLGHGIEGDAVASHPFFGSMEKIVGALKTFAKGWEKGVVVFNYGCMRREDHNNTDTLIVGFHECRYLEQECC